MAFAIFLMEAVIISLSGVMAPGPITAVTVGTGTKSPHAGAFVAFGHGIVEFPLMFLVFLGVGHVLNIGSVKTGVFIVGGLFLLFMGWDMLRSLRRVAALSEQNSGKPLLAGILLSAGNAYFLVWWATVGAGLITKAYMFGVVGVLTFAVIHWSCDFVWFYFISAVSYRGGDVFGVKFQRAVFLVCGIFLLILGVKFIRDGLLPWI